MDPQNKTLIHTTGFTQGYWFENRSMIPLIYSWCPFNASHLAKNSFHVKMNFKMNWIYFKFWKGLIKYFKKLNNNNNEK